MLLGTQRSFMSAIITSMTGLRLVSAFSTHSFFILRHGQTDANAEGLIQGSSDFSRLTIHGREQAATAAREAFLQPMEGNSVVTQMRSVYVSPLMRARETLSVLRDHAVEDSLLLPKAEVVLDNLREIDLYEWEGRNKKELKRDFASSYEAWKVGDPGNFIVKKECCDKQRYPLLELWERADQIWEDINDIERKTPKVGDSAYSSSMSSSLVVAHGSLGQALLGSAMGWDATYFRKHEFPNCGLVEVQWDVTDSSAEFNEAARRWRWRWPEVSAWMSKDDVPQYAGSAVEK